MDPKLLFLNKPAFGTDKIHRSEVIQNAIEAGYRHFDSATGYQNHPIVAEGIRRSNFSRRELFLASKLNHEDIDSIQQSTETILEELQTDYLDLLYLHTPNLATHQNLKELNKLRSKGVIKKIGISNLDSELLSFIIHSGYILDAVQVEIHPYYWNKKLIQICQQNKIAIYGYRPLGGGKTDILDNPTICTIAKKYKKSTSQIILRWLIDKGITPIVKSQNILRQRENLDVFDFALFPSEIEYIDSLKSTNQQTCHWEKKCHLTVL